MTNVEDAQKRAHEEILEAASLTPAVHKTESSARERAPATADSSGYVDLTALLAADPEWIDRAIDASRIRADASRGDDVEAPRARPHESEHATAQPRSLAPVAMASLLDPVESVASTWSATASGRRRRAFVALAGILVACAAIGGAAFLRRAPSSAHVAALTPIVPVVPTAPALTSEAIVAPPATASAVESATPPLVAPASSPAASAKVVSATKPAPRGRPLAGQSLPRAKTPPSAKKAPPRPSGGAPSLLDMMRSSAQAPPTKSKP